MNVIYVQARLYTKTSNLLGYLALKLKTANVSMIKHYLYVPWSKTKLLFATAIPVLLLVIVELTLSNNTMRSLARDLILLAITFSITIFVLAVYGRYQFWVKIDGDDVAFKLPGFTNRVTLKRGDIREVKWNKEQIAITSDTPYGLKTIPYNVKSIPHDQTEILVQYLRGAVDATGRITPLFKRAHLGRLPDVETWGLRHLLHAYPNRFPGMYSLAANRRNDQYTPLSIVFAPYFALFLVEFGDESGRFSILFAVFIGILAMLMFYLNRNFHCAKAEAFVAFGSEGNDDSQEIDNLQFISNEPHDADTSEGTKHSRSGQSANNETGEAELFKTKSHNSISVTTMVWKLPESNTVHSVSCEAVEKIDYGLYSIDLHVKDRPTLTISLHDLPYDGIQRIKEVLAEQMPSLISGSVLR